MPTPTPAPAPHLWVDSIVWHHSINNRTITIGVLNDGEAPGSDTCTLVVHAESDIIYTRKVSLTRGENASLDYDLSELPPGTYKADAFVKPGFRQTENFTFEIMILKEPIAINENNIFPFSYL